MADSVEWDEASSTMQADEPTEGHDPTDAEHELLAQVTQQRARLEAVLQQMPGGVIIVEAQSGRVLMINAEAERLARPPSSTSTAPDFPRDALIERGSRLVHPDSWPLTRALRAGQTTTNQEMQYLRDDGSLGTVLVSAAPIYNGGRIDAVVATFNDVTDQRAIQARLDERHAKLADDLRMANLDAERARADADRASAAKSEFLSTMSHEIRTPLNAIVGYVQLLEMGIGGVGTDAYRSHLQRLRMSSDHLLKLVSEVLDLAKAESGSLTFQQHTGQSDAVIEAAIGLIASLANARGIAIQHPSYAITEDRYIGDEDRVRQILVNLLGNAVKFTPSGGSVTIESGTVTNPHVEDSRLGTRTVRDGRWATISVTDTGIGIPPNRLAAIFEPFVQLGTANGAISTAADAGTLTPAQRGTGLGLAISRRLAQGMGGDLTVHSAERQGSAFTLWLPAP